MKKTYHILTIGCQMNISDSERLAAFLESLGFKKIDDLKKVSLLVINTCGVKQMAENRAYSFVKQVKENNPSVRIIITGCLSKREDVMKRLIGQVDWFLPAGDMALIPELLSGADYKPRFSLDEYRLKNGEKYLALEPKYENNYSAYVPIGNGCNNFCSYCVVPYARGREVYRDAKDIIKEVKALVKKGYKEITLIAQNVNSYKDEKYNFAELLAELIKIPGKFWLRFSSSHPKDMSDELIAVIGSSSKVADHLHLALQSGDDKILQAMNRKYSAARFKKLIKKVRAVKPGIAITTDIIVGFPGETEEQFLNTVKIFKEIVFDMAYISQYSPRPGTVSSKMKDDVSREEKKNRFKILNEVLKESALKSHQNYLGRTLDVLVDGKNRRGQYCGKSSAFKTVMISTKKKLQAGDLVSVLITKAMPFGLEGDLVLK